MIQEGVALHAAVISLSLSEHFLTSAEAAAMNAALEQARDQHVTVVAASGDRGAISSHDGPPVQVSMPASDPLVLGAGGTILDASPAGAYLGEMAWNDNTDASGGGYSSLFPRPAYQDGLARTRAPAPPRRTVGQQRVALPPRTGQAALRSKWRKCSEYPAQCLRGPALQARSTR